MGKDIIKKDLEFTGERVVPGKVDQALWNEHIARYNFAANFVQKKTVLDTGCGCGYGSNLLATNGAARVLGVDISSEAIEYARSHYQLHNLEFKVMDVSALDLKEKSFDVVVLLEVIEHIKDQERCLAEIKRVLKVNGLFIVSCPNQQEHPGESFNKFHVRELNYAEFLQLLKKYFRNVKIFAFGFSLGTFIYPMHDHDFKSMVIDTSLLQNEKDVEPPFFLALCSQAKLNFNNNLTRLYPFVFSRTDYTEYLNSAQERVRQEYINQAITAIIRDLVDEGKYAIALSFLEKISQKQPAHPEWNYFIAFCLQMLNQDLQRALKHYNLALDNGFNESWVRYNRGALHMELGNTEKASVDLKRARELNPEHAGIKELIQRISFLQQFKSRGVYSLSSSFRNRLVLKFANQYLKVRRLFHLDLTRKQHKKKVADNDH